MKSNPQFIEPLEARIAPAILVNGANLLGGKGNPSTGETSTGANTLTLVKVISGQALVFYNNGVISGISVGKHTQLDITGNVTGDIITNLLPSGRLTDSDGDPSNGEDGGILLPIGIKGVTTHKLGTEAGNVERIIAGGQVNNINVSGQLSGVYAGDGVFRDGDTVTINTGRANPNLLNPNPVYVPNQGYAYTVHQADSSFNAKAGIKNVTVATAAQLEIFAGSGGDSDQSTGLAGGSITNVTITATNSGQNSQPALFLHAGDGGLGVDKGGQGGSIINFNDKGTSAYVRLQPGDGGDATVGNGGQGGSFSSSTISTSSPRYDILTGNGGQGQHGGPGGNMDTVTFTNNITGGKSLVATADFNNDSKADVILLNTLTGETTVSLGAADRFDANGLPIPAFSVVLDQRVGQADGSVVSTPFLPAEGADATSLAVADFNGDGFLDFAVSYASSNSLGIYTNQHNGNLTPGHFAASRVDLTVSPTRIVTGDFSNTGHADLAIVSGGSIITQTGQSSQVFIAHNDGAGRLTVDTNAAATFNGVATDAAASLAYSSNSGAQIGTLLGTNLFVGLNNGTVQPLLFRSGAATVASPITVFTAPFSATGNASQNIPPVDGLDAVGSVNGTTQLVVFSRDINALAIANGDTTKSPLPQVAVYNVDANGQSGYPVVFNPGNEVTRVRIVPDSSFLAVSLQGGVVLFAPSVGQTTGATYGVSATLNTVDKLTDLAVARLNGDYQIAAAGAAPNIFDFASGQTGGSGTPLTLNTNYVPIRPRLISFVSGNGGDGDRAGGGNAGGIRSLNFTQTIASGVIEAGGAYNTELVTGHGGNSNGASGGKGGVIQKSTLSLTPGYLNNTLDPSTDLFTDDTTTASFIAGAGGQGFTGGNGGSIRKVTSTSVFTQGGGSPAIIGAVALRLLAGDGGEGLGGAGGNGGGIKLAGQAALSGVSFVDPNSLSEDPGLIARGGKGGDGATAGGKGGGLLNVGTQNALFNGAVINSNQLASALLEAGAGGAASAGNGGAGGSIEGGNVVVQRAVIPIFNPKKQIVDFYQKDGAESFVAGAGGASASAQGGAGGSITGSIVGSVNGDNYNERLGSLVLAGSGGAGGAGGGSGGNIEKLTLNSPADASIYAAIVAAGNGGNALDVGTGGGGGSILGIKQTKDVNSTINVIQAGNGGQGAGAVGGLGGSVTNVNTVGFVGVPASGGAFYTLTNSNSAIAPLFAYSQIPQGIFAGRGGDGAANGSVTNIVARQIAAIGATVQNNGTFGTAASVSNVSADLIGYGTNPNAASPSSVVPTSGFVLAEQVSGISTIDNGRTAAFTYNG